MKNSTPAPYGHTWISINAFTKKYLSVMPQDLFMDLQKRLLMGATSVTITSSTITELDTLLAKRKEEDKMLSSCAKLNDKGKAYEKVGKIKSAITTYEKNIESDYPAHYSFKRLMVLYRKNKDFENEMRIIRRAMTLFPNEIEYKERLAKTKELSIKKQ